MKKLILFCSLLILAVGVNAEKVSRYINLGSPAVVPKGLSFVTVSTNVTDYRVSTDSTKYILIDASQDYPSQQDVLVNMTAISGSPSVAITLQGKKFLTDSWAEVISVQTWTSSAVKLASTAPTRYRYYAIKMVCSTAPAWPSTVQFKQWFVSPDVTANSFTDGTMTWEAGALTGATTGAFSGAVTVGGALGVTGAITGAAGVNLGTSQALVGTTAMTIGNNGQTVAVNSSDWDISTTGAMTGMGAATFDGVITATGGLDFATGSTVFWAKGGAPLAVATGTDAAATAGDRYWVELEIPHNATITGLSYLVGSVGGTDSVMVHLYNAAGTQVATSKKTGSAHGNIVGTAAEIQSVPFTATYAAVAGKYFAAIQFNGTTAKFRAYLIPGSKFVASSAAGTYDTAVASITPGTTWTVSKGPIIATY